MEQALGTIIYIGHVLKNILLGIVFVAVILIVGTILAATD